MFVIKKRHSLYPNVMSEEKTILKTSKVRYTVQEYYGSLHYLSLNKWIKDKEDDLFTLKKWKHIPLNGRTSKLFKLFDKEQKYESRLQKVKDKVQIEIAKRGYTVFNIRR